MLPESNVSTRERFSFQRRPLAGTTNASSSAPESNRGKCRRRGAMEPAARDRGRRAVRRWDTGCSGKRQRRWGRRGERAVGTRPRREPPCGKEGAAGKRRR
ncbi:unnamed protein product [Urochloa humidicola]